MHRWAGKRGLGKNGCHVPQPGRWYRLSEQKTPLPPPVSVGSKRTAQAFCCSWFPVLKKHRAHLSVLPVLLLHPRSTLDGGRMCSYLSFQSLRSPHTALVHGFSSSSPSTPPGPHYYFQAFTAVRPLTLKEVESRVRAQEQSSQHSEPASCLCSRDVRVCHLPCSRPGLPSGSQSGDAAQQVLTRSKDRSRRATSQLG